MRALPFVAVLAPALALGTRALAQGAAPASTDPNARSEGDPAPAVIPTQVETTVALRKAPDRELERVYAVVEGGFAYMSVGNDPSLSLKRTEGAGGMFGVGAGVRLMVLTLGARFRYSLVGAFNMAQINAVVGFHIPAGKWDPYIAIHGGYCVVGSFGDGTAPVAPGDDPERVNVRGGNIGVSGGVDYYFVRVFSLGVDASAEAMFLARPRIDPPQGVPLNDPSLVGNGLYHQSGSAIGYGLSGSVHAGLHF